MFKSRIAKIIYIPLLLFAVANVPCLFHFEEMGQHVECEASHHLLTQNMPASLAKTIVWFAALPLLLSATKRTLDIFNIRSQNTPFFALDSSISPPSFLQEAFSSGILNPKIY